MRGRRPSQENGGDAIVLKELSSALASRPANRVVTSDPVEPLGGVWRRHWWPGGVPPGSPPAVNRFPDEIVVSRGESGGPVQDPGWRTAPERSKPSFFWRRRKGARRQIRKVTVSSIIQPPTVPLRCYLCVSMQTRVCYTSLNMWEFSHPLPILLRPFSRILNH